MNVVHTSDRHVGPMSCGPCLAVAVPAATSRAAAAVAVLTVGAARRSEREVAGVSARLTHGRFIDVIVRHRRAAALARAVSGMSALANRLGTVAAALVRRLRGDGGPAHTETAATPGPTEPAGSVDGMRTRAASSGAMPLYRTTERMSAAWAATCRALSGKRDAGGVPLAVPGSADELSGLPGAGEWLHGVPCGAATP